MTENQALKLCKEVFPKLDESDSMDKLRTELLLSPRSQAMFRKADELARELGMPHSIESRVPDKTRLALMADGCKFVKSKSELSKEDRDFIWKSIEQADVLLAESVFKHGGDKFASVYKLEGEAKADLDGQWTPQFSKREQVLKRELEDRLQVLVVPRLSEKMDKPDFYLYARPHANARDFRMGPSPIISPFLFR